MYPRDFLDSYWRPTLKDIVFVAMPFHEEFLGVWEDAIRPAAEQDLMPPLSAVRVDVSSLSGSIVTDILDGIGHARVVLSDISVAQEGRWRGQRNANVMYEVGLAHAARQSTEVILIRSDIEEINFDLAGIRVHSYDKSNLGAARSLIHALLRDAIKQIDQTKSLLVQKALDALDADAMVFIASWGNESGFHGPSPQNMGGALLSINKSAALSRLQTLGIVRCDPNHTSGQVAFFWTEFGNAVIAKLRPALPNRVDAVTY
ncbi:MAG: hypothetical protein EXR86_10090 [Gammaproteobacteria bacterium]|nr:hypothetical protein [Gammaproteobacteria bacterium]